MTDPIAAGVLEACAVMRGPDDDPDSTAHDLGEVLEGVAAEQLILVRPTDTRWKRIQVQADRDGRLVGLVLELPDGASVMAEELEPSLGAPDEEWPPDARRPTFIYDEPSGACRILASVIRGPDGRWLANRFQVVRR